MKGSGRATSLAVILSILVFSAFLQGAHGFTNGQSAFLITGPISSPTNLLFDPRGDLWVGTLSGEVLEFKPPFSNNMAASFALKGSVAQGSNFTAVDITFDPSGNLWVVDGGNNRILEFKPPFSSEMNASLVIGQSGFKSIVQTGSLSAYSLDPTNAAFDSAGDLWANDIQADRVLEFRPPFSNGMAASLVLGQRDFFTDSHVVSQSTLRFNHPGGDITFEKEGNLWVSSDLGNRVLEFRPPFSNGMNASLVIGQPNFTSSSNSSSLNGLSMPLGVAFDANGNLWVGDVVNNKRVLQFQPPFTNGMKASLALGQSTLGCCAYLEGGYMAFDSSGNLWVSDQANNRVVKFLASVTAVASSASTTTTSTSTTPATTTTTTPTPSTSSTSSTSSSIATTTATTTGGGIPEFPYQLVVVSVFTVLIGASYLLVKRYGIPNWWGSES